MTASNLENKGSIQKQQRTHFKHKKDFLLDFVFFQRKKQHTRYVLRGAASEKRTHILPQIVLLGIWHRNTLIQGILTDTRTPSR